MFLVVEIISRLGRDIISNTCDLDAPLFDQNRSLYIWFTLLAADVWDFIVVVDALASKNHSLYIQFTLSDVPAFQYLKPAAILLTSWFW